MKSFRTLFLLIIISSKGFGQNDTINIYSIDVYNITGVWKDAQRVSIDNLLKEPKKYNNKLISVYGYISLGADKINKIYGSEETYKNQNNNDAIFYAQFTEDTYKVLKKFKEGYAIITGLFIAVKDEECNGMIYEIRRIDIPK